MLPAVAAEIRTVSTLAELAAAAAGDDAVVEMPPGTYRLRDLVTPEGIRDRRERHDFAFFRFSGSRNKFRLHGVVIEVDTRLRSELRPPIHTDEFVVGGAGNVIEGLAIVNMGGGTSHGGAAIGVSGTGNTLRDVSVTVRGSAPYGYGDLFGKGGLKHSGIHVTGDGTRLLGCRVRVEAFGHGVYLQEDAADVLIEDCEVSGVIRPTDDILAEQKGLAHDRGFLMEMRSRAGDHRILPGYRKALAEDAFRTYGEHPGLVIRRSTARDMRGGFELRTRAGPVVEGCTALGCERGFWVSDKAVVSRCRADFRHGPALYAERDGASIDLELLPSQSDATVHAAAVIAGKGNRVRLTADGPLGREMPILVGYGPPGMGENMAPFREPWTGENELVNLTPLPVVVGKRASRDRIETVGPVVENLGRDVTVVRRVAGGDAAQSP